MTGYQTIVSSFCDAQLLPPALLQHPHGVAAGPPPDRHFVRSSQSTPSLVLTGPPHDSPRDGDSVGGSGCVRITTGHATPELRIVVGSPSAAGASKACNSGAAFPASPSFHGGLNPGSMITSSSTPAPFSGRNSSLPAASSWANVPLFTSGPSASAGAQKYSDP